MSKKFINLKITNNSYEESLKPKGDAFSRELKLEDSFEIDTEGILYLKNDSTFISYEESEEAGLLGCKTVLKHADGKLHVMRYGKPGITDTNMVFEEGVTTIMQYQVPFDRIDIEMYTNKLDYGLDDEGYGKIDVDYSLKISDLDKTRIKLGIEISPA